MLRQAFQGLFQQGRVRVALPCRWHKAVDKVRAALPDHVTVQPWKMHIFSQLPYPDNYKQFKQRRGSQLHPIEAPQHLPALPSGLDAGQVPLFSELKDAVAAASSGRQAAEVNVIMWIPYAWPFATQEG